MSGARAVLARLLARAESARLRGSSKPASLSMASQRDAGEYIGLRALSAIESFHAQVALAEREGAIKVERDRHRGDGERLGRITVADLAVLAAHLGCETLESRNAVASALLEPSVGTLPVLEKVLGAWGTGGKVRGQGPEAAVDLADAARAVLARRADVGHERILRRESTRLFSDSKRLERLTPWLELLVSGELAATGLENEHVWAALGLRREPQPMLMAGEGVVMLEGMRRVPLVRPYLGLPVEAVRGIETTARAVLTIENLASFHDAARHPQAADVLLLYTGGMPSPAWRAAFGNMLADLGPETCLHHWGDIDVGGFRIAAQLAAIVRQRAMVLAPWLMSPVVLPAEILEHAHVPTSAERDAMVESARKAGWDELADALHERPIKLEQEMILPQLPSRD